MLELSDVYYPEGGAGAGAGGGAGGSGGGSAAKDTYRADDDEGGSEVDGYGRARRSAVTFLAVGRKNRPGYGEKGESSDDEEPIDFNPPSDHEEDANVNANDGNEEEKALATTPSYNNLDSSSQNSTGRPETATKSQRDALLLLSGASTGAVGGGGASATTAAASADTTVLPGERNSLMGGLGLSARSHQDDPDPTLSGVGAAAAADDSLSASQASIGASIGAGRHNNMDRTVRPDERASLLGGLGLSAASADNDPSRGSSIAGPGAGAGGGAGSAGGRRLDNNSSNNNKSDLEDFCTAASKQDVEDDDQMTDGTATTNNTNRYFTGREDGEEEEEEGHNDNNDYYDSDATDIDEDVVGQDSEATVSHSMPSPSTERKSNISRSRNNSSSNLHRLSRVDAMDSAAGDEASPNRAGAGGGELSTLEEGSCEISMNTTGTSSTSQQRKHRSTSNANANAAADDTIQEPSQCQSLVGHVRNMERRLDSALADAMRSPSPRVNTSGRSGLDQSCAIPQGDDVEIYDDEGPVFGSQGLSPIMLAGSQMDPTFDYEEEVAEEEHEEEDQDQKPKAKSKQNDSKPIESKPESPPNNDSKKRKAATPSNTAHSLRESTRRASSAECKPRVFFLSHSSALSAAHVRTVRRCIKSNKLSAVGDGTDHTNGTDNSDLDIPYDFETPSGIASFISVLKATKDAGGTIYGVSTNSEYQYADGYIVPRSFRYLLGVAAGLPMVDIDFLTNNANANSRGPLGRYLLPTGAGATDSTDGDGGRSKRARRGPSDNVDPFRDPQSGCPYDVCGDTDAKEIGAPQRSIASKQGLFGGYSILLFGDFDHIAPANSKSGGRKRRGAASSATAKVDDSDLYSKGRISLLLQLCGATVAGLKEVVEASEAKASSLAATTVPSNIRDVMAVLQSASARRTNDNIVVLVKRKAAAKDYKQANKYLKEHGESFGLVEQCPILSADWAVDSISDFSVRKCDEYSK